MSFSTNLHELLSTNSCNLEEIRNFLECDNSSINDINLLGRAPLSIALMNPKCSIDIVRLLLQYGSDVNLRDKYSYTPLLTALEYSTDEAIIAALLEKAININNHDEMGRSPLRYVYNNCGKYRTNPELIKNAKPERKENILNLLLKAGLDLNKVSEKGRSPLCFVLYKGADVHDIELLLRKGGSLNACQKHTSPLHCPTDGFSGALLKANVVQLILDKQDSKDQVFKMNLKHLQNALRLCRYETTAIKLLLEHLDRNAADNWIQQTSDFLHLVVHNEYCKPSIVKLVLQQGACIGKPNIHGKTPLHIALTCHRPDVSVIKCLLKNGAPLNVKCENGETPLSLAVQIEIGTYVINLLLSFGASVSYNLNVISLFKRFLNQFKCNGNQKHIFKILVKYYLLENPYFSLQNLIKDHWDHDRLSDFASKCADELQRMESKNVRSDYTLRRFIGENVLQNIQEIKVANDDFNQLLKILSCNEFPEFFYIIASRITASKVVNQLLTQNLRELIVYTADHCTVKACLIKKIMLNYDIVCKLAIFLSDEELLSLIVAFL